MSHAGALPYLLLSPADLEKIPDFAGMDSDELDEICEAVTDEIERAVGRKFRERDYVGESYRSNGRRELRLRNPPIADISAITEIRRIVGDDTETLDLTELRVVDIENGVIYHPAGFGPRPSYDRPTGRGLDDPAGSGFVEDAAPGALPVLFEVDYTGGYVRLPAMVRRVARELAVAMLGRTEGLGMESETIGSYSYRRASASAENPWAAKVPSWEGLMTYDLRPGCR